MVNCIIVGLGGFIGAVIRYLIGLIPVSPQNGFPIKTLLINILGAFVIGLVVAFWGKKGMESAVNSVFEGRNMWRIYDFFLLCS